MKVNIVFHRHYTIEGDEIISLLKKENQEINDFNIKQKAEELALKELSNDIIYFENNMNDFMSVTSEIIKDE